MNDNMASLQKAIRMKDNIIERMCDVMSAMVDEKLETQKLMTRLEMKMDDLSRRVQAIEEKSERWEREVAKFERLNNANEWVKP